MTRVSSARKQESSPKRGKTRIQCQARENNNPISSAGKLKSNDKRGKTKIWFQARENKNPVSSAGKQEFGVKRGKQAGSATGGKTEAQQNSQLVPDQYGKTGQTLVWLWSRPKKLKKESVPFVGEKVNPDVRVRWCCGLLGCQAFSSNNCDI